MTRFLRELTINQQIGMLFVALFGLLLVGSIVMVAVSWKTEEHDPAHDELERLTSVLRNSWIMAVLFWVAWAAGEQVVIFLFFVGSFFALREFITLSPTKRGDHRSLILAFFVVLPIQYLLVSHGLDSYFSTFIPVYVFFLIPVVSALANDPHRFLERNAKLQWGIMVCVFGLSHVPALLLLQFPGYEGRGAFLVFFLVIVVQGGMLIQHLISRKLSYAPVAPDVSKGFHWRGWLYGLFFSGVLGALMSGITPFKPGQAFVAALLACAAATLGHLVMKALKRDRGVRSWGEQGLVTTGASGLLDRIDGLCFAAPVFFHSARLYYSA